MTNNYWHLLAVICFAVFACGQDKSNLDFCRQCPAGCQSIEKVDGSCPGCICDGLLLPDCEVTDCAANCEVTRDQDGCMQCLCPEEQLTTEAQIQRQEIDERLQPDLQLEVQNVQDVIESFTPPAQEDSRIGIQSVVNPEANLQPQDLDQFDQQPQGFDQYDQQPQGFDQYDQQPQGFDQYDQQPQDFDQYDQQPQGFDQYDQRPQDVNPFLDQQPQPFEQQPALQDFNGQNARRPQQPPQQPPNNGQIKICPPLPPCPQRCQTRLGSNNCPVCECPESNVLPFSLDSNNREKPTQNQDPETKTCPAMPECPVGCIDKIGDQDMECYLCNCTVDAENALDENNANSNNDNRGRPQGSNNFNQQQPFNNNQFNNQQQPGFSSNDPFKQSIRCGETSCPPGCRLCRNSNDGCGRCLCGSSGNMCPAVPSCRLSCLQMTRSGCITCRCGQPSNVFVQIPFHTPNIRPTIFQLIRPRPLGSNFKSVSQISLPFRF